LLDAVPREKDLAGDILNLSDFSPSSMAKPYEEPNNQGHDNRTAPERHAVLLKKVGSIVQSHG
jgi:hypothetical protein